MWAKHHPPFAPTEVGAQYLVGWAKAVARPLTQRKSLVRRAHQRTSMEAAASMVGTAQDGLCHAETRCPRLCPFYKLRLTVGRSTRMENALTLRGRDLERRLQRPWQLARTLAQSVLEPAQLRPHGRDRPRLDRTVGFDQLLPEWRERGAAALRAARLGGDDRLAEALVPIVDQEPGAPVGHVERAAGLRDRAGPADRLKQSDLARAQSPLGAEIDPHRQPNVVHGPLRAAE